MQLLSHMVHSHAKHRTTLKEPHNSRIRYRNPNIMQVTHQFQLTKLYRTCRLHRHNNLLPKNILATILPLVCHNLATALPLLCHFLAENRHYIIHIYTYDSHPKLNEYLPSIHQALLSALLSICPIPLQHLPTPHQYLPNLTKSPMPISYATANI